MSLDTSAVDKIAHLARLAIHDQDKEKYATDLNNILALVDQLQAINTDNVEPLANPLDEVQRLRDDIVTESDQHQHFQKQAPKVEAGLYLVPQVIE